MAYSYVRYSGNGSTTNYTFSFPTISTDHIKVRVNGTLVTNWSFLNSSTIQFAAAPASGAVIEIRRETPKDSTIVNFTDGSVLLERDLDLLATWQLYLGQETEDDIEDTIRVDSQSRFDAQNRRIINVADPINAQDAVTKVYADAVIGQATAAASAAAAVQVALAADEAVDSAASALAAASSASSAGTSATNAASSASAAAAAYDSFDDRYLGAKAVAPTVDNDGNALLTGAIYWSTTSNEMFVWSGSSWGKTFVTGSVARSVVTASAGQTVVTTPTYTIGANTLQVFVNGVKVLVGADYTETSQTSITLASGLSAGDEIELIAVQPFAIGTTGAQNVSFTQTGTGAVPRTVDAKLKEAISVSDFIPAGTNTVITDCTAYIQAAINAAAGKTLYFDQLTYKTTSSLLISSHNTKVEARGATIDYYGTSYAVGFGLVNGTTFPVEIGIRQLSIIVNNGPSSSGIQVKTSSSQFEEVAVLLRASATSAKGFVIVGDEANGTGCYYNLFLRCGVQSGSAGTDHIGVLFYAEAPIYRCPNANTWIGGRVGQCATGFVIKGNGNTFFNPTVENAAATGTAFKFEADTANNCFQNQIFASYIENANIAVQFTANSGNNSVYSQFMTGVVTKLSDSGTENLVIDTNSTAKLPLGVKFGTLSSDPNVLDYYEEGNWTPTLVGGTTAGSYTITATGAKYTRIGNKVTVTGKLAIGINSAGTGEVRFGGLPYAKGANQFLCGSITTQNVILDAAMRTLEPAAWTSSSDSTFTITGARSNTSPKFILCSDLTSGAYVIVTFEYFV